MKKKSKKIPSVAIIAGIIVAVIAFSALVIHNYKTKTSIKNAEATSESQTTESSTHEDAVIAATNSNKPDAEAVNEARKNSPILKISESDVILGDKAAPVTIIEYASLSCPHCSAFHHEALERLKAEYIDSNKVKFIYRNFPLNQPALAAAMFVNCQTQDHKAESSEKYYNLIKALFKTQDSWAFDPKYIEKLQSIAQLDGMSAERFTACINNHDLQEKILSRRMEASKELQIQSTPTFFVNGEIIEGYIDYLSIKKVVDRKLGIEAK